MSSAQTRREVELTVVAFAVVSVVVLIATPALAAPSTNGEPAITTNWWVVLGSLFVGTLVVQGIALMLARRQRSTPALIVSMLFAWLVVETATGVMWVSVTMLTLGLAVIGQQVGRRPAWVLAAQTVALIAVLAVIRQQTLDAIFGSQLHPRWQSVLGGYLVVGVATVITWQTWAQDRRLTGLAVELRASRLRLVEAGDAARRALERDLHDGAQQRIVTASLNLATARRLLGTHHERAESMLATTQHDLNQAAAQLRDVSHGIYPTELARDGLEPALRTLATRASLPVTVEVRDTGRLGDDVDAAVYFCCAEAVQNATKHAGQGAHVSILVEGATSGLALTVTDDGAGFDSTTAADGHGLSNIRDRIGAVGGTLDVHATPGHGTTIHATIGPRTASATRDSDAEPRRSSGRPRALVRRFTIGIAVAAGSVAVFAVSALVGIHVVDSVRMAYVMTFAALALVVPVLAAAWRSRRPWEAVVAGLLTFYWLATVILVVDQPFGAHVWILVLVVGVLVLPTIRRPGLVLAPAATATVLAMSVQFARIDSPDWHNVIPRNVELALGLSAYLVQLLGFVLIVLRSVSRHRSARRTIADVAASRLRLVEAGDAARRALERDLHDGAQQRIVTASLNLATARRLLGTHHERAESMLATTQHDLNQAAAQLRDVSHGIYPTELARDGLEPALRTLATRASLPVTVEVRDTGRLGDDVDAAVYFCCAEAVQNATKHAGQGAHVSILVEGATSGLALTVTDDGAGFDSTTAADGHGLSNIRDRIGAVGGTLDVHATPGHGTTIHATVPATATGDPPTNHRIWMPFPPTIRPAGT